MVRTAKSAPYLGNVGYICLGLGRTGPTERLQLHDPFTIIGHAISRLTRWNRPLPA